MTTRPKNRLLEQLDSCAAEDDFPTWANAHFTTAAMRVSGFTWKKADALLFEVLAYARASDEVQRKVYAYGAVPRVGYRGDLEPLLGQEDLREDIDDSSWRSRVSGVLFVERKGEVETYAPEGGVRKTFRARVDDKVVEVPVRLPSLGKAARPPGVERLTPEEAMLFQLVAKVPRDRLFDGAAARRLARVPSSAVEAFVIDDWEHPRPGRAASTSPDLRELTSALVERRAAARLRGKANGSFRHWLRQIVTLHSSEEAGEWGKRPASEAPRTGPEAQVSAKEPTKPNSKSKQQTKPRSAARAAQAAPPEEKVAWLDEAEYHPAWDAPSEPCGAMRLTGLRTKRGPLLVLEGIVASTGRAVSRRTFAWGPGLKAKADFGRIGDLPLVPLRRLYDVTDDGKISATLRCRVAKGESIDVPAAGAEITLALPAGVRAPGSERLRPHEMALYALCSSVGREALFGTAAALKKAAGVEAGAEIAVVVEDPLVPGVGRTLGAMAEVQAVAAELSGSGKVRWGGETTRWQAWITKVTAARRASDAKEWTQVVRVAI